MAVNLSSSPLAEAAAAMFREAAQVTMKGWEQMKGAFAGLAGVKVDGGIAEAAVVATPSSGHGRGGGRGGGGIV